MSPQHHKIERLIPLPRSKVWELLSRTDHLNRVIGLYPIVRRVPRFQGSHVLQDMTAKAFGVVPMRWREHPFEWVALERYSVVREYDGGPLRKFVGGILLQDAQEMLEDGSPATLVTLFAEFTPAHILGLATIPLIGVRAMHKTMDFLQESVRLSSIAKSYLLPQTKAHFPVNRRELDRLIGGLSLYGFEPALLGRLREHLESSGDDGVIDMRPFQLADAWQMNRDVVLRLFLYATRSGILNLSWQLICPNCRVSKLGAERLSAITPQYHCDMCGIDYEASFDRYVELCFSVHPHIRRASKQVYCIGGPMITPHIHTQLELASGASGELVYPGGEAPMRLRVLRMNRMVSLNGGGTGSWQTDPCTNGEVWKLEYGADGEWSVAATAEPPPGTVLRLTNRSPDTIHVALERSDWSGDTVTAAKVTAMQEFRTLFSSEVLAPGQQIGIESVTLLFSDLRGSTAFYEQVGDAQAYSQVRRHFEFLIGHIAANEGALVKTIGDAVMAVFESPEKAVRAALDIQTSVQTQTEEEQVVIKLGLYNGPAIAVNGGDVLDYFGRTVNLAARAQGLSRGGDIVVSRECTLRPGVQELLDIYGPDVEFFRERLKGIDGETELARLIVTGAASGRTESYELESV
ncbi:adenylate/guanylate cyclase domain-containing protein [Paenibacillus filicis]|uniref:Adenylate/guanylate cyclase domain-containing protein n=1 Tax=Paenibacillus filicis TaxID=669464 RepID=A0ABU9DSX4_9BACL